VSPANRTAAAPLDRDALAEIRRIQVRTDRMVTDVLAGGYSSVFRGSGIEFEEVREFTEGDDPRSIDWNVTARTGRPHIKKFVEERELTVMLLLDLSASTRFGTREQGPSGRLRSVRATAALFCGCVAFAAARNNDKAGLVAFSDRVERHLPAKKGRGHVLRLIRDAYAHEPVGKGTDLAAALEFAGRVQRRRAVVFLITDAFAEVPEHEMRVLSRRHDLVLVRVRDPRSEQLPAAGLLRLRDLETGAERWVDSSSRAVRSALEAGAQRARREVDEVCRRAGIDVLDVSTHGSVADPIVRFFRMRERRGAHR
jgi:uncharacterized protein (DUF58 family)